MASMTRGVRPRIGATRPRRARPLTPEQLDQRERRRVIFFTKSVLIAGPLVLIALGSMGIPTPSPIHEVKASVLDAEFLSAMVPYLNSCRATLRIEEGYFKGQELTCKQGSTSRGCSALEKSKDGSFIVTFKEIDRSQREEINPQPFNCLSFKPAR